MIRNQLQPQTFGANLEFDSPCMSCGGGKASEPEKVQSFGGSFEPYTLSPNMPLNNHIQGSVETENQQQAKQGKNNVAILSISSVLLGGFIWWYTN